MNQLQTIIIDTDPGYDDVMAIMLACSSPGIKVKALTTVAGNSSIENTTRNARFILDFLGRNDIPVFSGADKPLNRELVQAVVHGESGLDGINPTNASNLTNNAAQQLVDMMKDSAEKITIVTLGPLTNIAQAIQLDPLAMVKVEQIVIMGGAIHAAGNKNRVAEFNIFVDPEAADIVMRFDVPKVLLPLDSSNHVQLTLADLEGFTNPRTKDLIEAMLTPYIANIEKDTGVAAALMYDPTTIFYLLEPEACRVETYNVLVETKGEATRGMTVAERRVVPEPGGNDVSVVMDINQERFTARFITALNRL